MNWIFFLSATHKFEQFIRLIKQLNASLNLAEGLENRAALSNAAWYEKNIIGGNAFNSRISYVLLCQFNFGKVLEYSFIADDDRK